MSLLNVSVMLSMLCKENDMDTQEYLSGLSNEELMAKIGEAKYDLGRAANEEPNSKWHQSCFAAFFMMAQEAAKRGLKLSTVH